MPHETEIVRDGLRRWRAICNCKHGSPFFAERQEAEDWKFAHLRLAEQAMVHLRSRNPSLKDQFNYYSEKALDTSESVTDRQLWQQLADGLRPRIAVPSTDEPLPLEIKYTPRRTRSRDDP